MATVDADDLEFCRDCVMVIANGDCFDSEGNDIGAEIAEKQMAIWGEGWDGALGLVLTDTATSDSEGWFSWSRCDGCGSTLGGDRYPGAHLTND